MLGISGIFMAGGDAQVRFICASGVTRGTGGRNGCHVYPPCRQRRLPCPVKEILWNTKCLYFVPVFRFLKWYPVHKASEAHGFCLTAFHEQITVHFCSRIAGWHRLLKWHPVHKASEAHGFCVTAFHEQKTALLCSRIALVTPT